MAEKRIKKIVIKYKPANNLRYATWGDYYTKRRTIHIDVLEDLPNDLRFAITMHELVEKYLCDKAGITDKQIDDWDFSYPDAKEPGEISGCPYFEQHARAMDIERVAMKLTSEKGAA
jgi:hypothetical protein